MTSEYDWDEDGVADETYVDTRPTPTMQMET